MEKYGPLYHRNGARLLPKFVAKLCIGIVLAIAIVEVVLGIASLVH